MKLSVGGAEILRTTVRRKAKILLQLPATGRTMTLLLLPATGNTQTLLHLLGSTGIVNPSLMKKT